MQRRTFAIGTACAASALVGSAGTARAAARRTGTARGALARTTAGLVQGERIGNVSVFRGVPYARPPVGDLRFAAPRPPRPWSGVREATRFAPTALQSTGGSGSEDCLYANVWTPDTAGRRPVFVFIHGGGWRTGAGSLPTYDGARLARHGGLVVITFNYRLGAFGWGLHEDLSDPLTGDCANWGLQDQAALLHWAQHNAAAFGGDPANITLCGSSAGGSSAWQLSLLPELRGVVRRTVPISAAHAWAPAIGLTPDDARQAYERMAHRHGTTVRGLREVPARALRDSWQQLFSGAPGDRALSSGREYQGPVLDGRWMRGNDSDLPTPSVPMMVIGTHTEGSFFTGPNPPTPPPTPAPTDAATLHDAVRGVLLKGTAEISAAQVDACIAAYREAAAADGLSDTPLSLWTEIWGDGLFRYQGIRLAERHARVGGTPVYVMDFAHPVRAPWFGTPHEATSKFLFGTYALPENVAQLGDGPREERVSRTFMDLIASFSHHGVPSSPAAPHWPEFTPGRASTLVLGGTDRPRIGPLPKSRQLRYWDHAGWVPSVRPVPRTSGPDRT
ncbi:carboxylesterase/lipase family protein [Streptomyces sp. 130]|uniref:carboxylesterase/lipase family protein n=1 Tax=Streptomyces sp. 130 TaxID=2591006 RepID=UPI0021B0D0B8|nr:carboxylesterase family protein [Streptomyces sp. 130]